MIESDPKCGVCEREEKRVSVTERLESHSFNDFVEVSTWNGITWSSLFAHLFITQHQISINFLQSDAEVDA